MPTRSIITINICLFVTGAVLVSGVNSVAALAVALTAAIGALTNWNQDRKEHLVTQKAEKMEALVTTHRANCYMSTTMFSSSISSVDVES